LDHRLVEYAARIPSRLKIRGLSNSKYIYRKALEKVLPAKILYDRPKLGHSVPLKNWLREDSGLQEWVADVLSEQSIGKRRLFRPGFLRRLFDEHVSGRHNHSHRLWGLLVLELWMREWLDS
jgi:asparagine synthase (glutamine-hydrolysing)